MHTQSLAPPTPTPRLAVHLKAALGCVLFLTLVPTFAQWQFSWMGFTPTDEGYVLMSSRRLLAGEVPHRDFISEKPVLSPLLHVPEVAWGGDYTFWISRYVVWVQFAVIGWAWAEMLTSLLLPGLGLRYVAAFALLGFVFSSNTFPPIAWHTIDALFLLSLGLVLRIRFCRFNFLAYFLIGAAYLCKQTFAAAFFGALIATGDWRRPRYWVAALLPATIYFALLSRVGALSDAVVQLTAQRGIFDPGVRSYVMTPYVPWGILSGIGLGWLIHYNKRSPSTLGLWAVCTGLCGCALALLVRGMYWFGKVPGYGLFGVTLGLLISALLYAHALSFVRAGLLVLAAAWCTSISVGFNSPNLAAGPLACFVLIAAIALTRPMIAERHISYVVSVMLIVALTSFTVARWHWTYRDAPAAKLTGKLGGIFPGAKSIRTNANTLAYLQDLQLAISRVHGHPYIILPDTAAYWVRSSELNPISSDWPLYIELANDALVHRVERDLERQKGKSVILLEKIAVEDLATGFRPLVQDNYPILPYVHKNFRKIDETKFFDILD